MIEPGTRFGSVIYLSEAGFVGKNRRMVNCECECKRTFVTRLESLKSGDVITCPQCSAKRVWSKTWKYGRPLEYDCWANMIQRCYNPNTLGYQNWGGRGITVCDRWRNSFEAFIADMGTRPGSCRGLDRIDNDRGYEPGNCRWATQRQQMRNTRRNVIIEHKGCRACLTDWAESLGVKPDTLKSRLRRLDKEQVLSGSKLLQLEAVKP